MSQPRSPFLFDASAPSIEDKGVQCKLCALILKMAESRPDMQLDMLTDWDCFQETDLCEQHVLSLLMLLEKKVGDETVITIGMVVDMRADVLPLAA